MKFAAGEYSDRLLERYQKIMQFQPVSTASGGYVAIETFTLENGMQVLLEENHAAKVVSFNALIKVGSADEADSEAGICHVIEHMLFKGTPTRPVGTIARDVEAAGGDINAYTSIDQTVFYINMATQFADTGLSILADAIKNPLFDAEELEREKEVILEEIRREEDNPSRMLSEGLFREAFASHTYGRPIIGYPNTVKSFTRDEIIGFYRKWYSPKNIVFIAVGDFEIKDMFEKIRRNFSGFDGPDASERKFTEEPVRSRPRVVVKEMNIQSAYFAIGFNVPKITHKDVPSLDVLAHIFGGTESSRLEQEIKEKQKIVHNIYSYAFTPKDPGLFVIGAMLEDKKLMSVIGAIKKEVDKISSEPVTSEELSHAKINIRSGEVYEKETVGGQAGKIALFISTAGSHEFEQRYYQALADVGSQNVREAAEKYLKFEGASAVLIVPEGSKLKNAGKIIEDAFFAPGKTKSSKRGPKKSEAVRMRLENGAWLIVKENHNVPLVSICAATLGGTRFENKKNNGISGLVARLLTKGTTSRPAVEIARDIEKLAGRIDGFTGRNSIGLKCDFLSEHLHDGFEIFADVLIRPAFRNDEVTKEKRLALKAIKDQEDALSSFVFVEFLKRLFPRHPYGLRTLGTTQSVKSLKREDIVRYHRSLMCSGNVVLSVVGDVNPKEAENLANKLLKDLPKGKSPVFNIPVDERPGKIRETAIIKHKKQQAHIVLGFQGTTFKREDRYAMSVLNNVLAGQGGRLFLELRDKKSLAYAVASVNQEGVEPGFFAVYIGTEPQKAKIAVDGILGELKLVMTEQISGEELERSKQYLVGTYELELQRNAAVAGIYAFNELYGLPMSEIDRYPQRILSVTRADVLAAARRYIHPDAYTLAIIRP